MEEKKELKDLKLGDEVLLRTQCLERICLVERLTKTQIKLEGIVGKYRINNGRSLSGHGGIVSIPTEKDYARIKRNIARRQLENEIKKIDFYSLPSDKLERILKIVNE